MAANRLERAVIAAARSLVAADPYNIFASKSDTTVTSLLDAIEALDAADLPQEMGWHQVAAGDSVKSLKNGKFYAVISVIALADGRRQLTLDLAGSPRAIVRPTDAEPTAIVRRGPDGVAVDTFVNVFASGGMR